MLQQDGREVALMRLAVQRGGAVAPSEYQSLPFEEAAVWIVAQVVGDAVGRPLVVALVEHRRRDGDELALVAGCSAALGEPAGRSWPEHILLALYHALHVGADLVVHLQRHTLAKCLVVVKVGKVVSFSPNGMGRLIEQIAQLGLLQAGCLSLPPLQLFKPSAKEESGRLGEKWHYFRLVFV